MSLDTAAPRCHLCGAHQLVAKESVLKYGKSQPEDLIGLASSRTDGVNPA